MRGLDDLDELDRDPDWPPERGVFLALELQGVGDDAGEMYPTEGRRERIEEMLTRRFGLEMFDELVAAVSLFDLPNHTFINQWPSHYFTTSNSTVAGYIEAAVVHARAVASALRVDPSLLPTFREVAEVAWSQYKLEAASGLFEILLDALSAPNDQADRSKIADCHFFLGMIYRTTRPEDAEKHFQHFLKLAPKRCPDNNWPINPGYIPSMHHRPSSVMAWAELGRFSRMRGDVGRTRACFRKAIELDPKSQEAPYRELGESFEVAGDRRKALREYRKSLEVRSAAFIDDPRKWNLLERPYRRELVELCLRMVPHVEPREAKGLLQRALAFDPDDASRWLTQMESIFEEAPEVERQLECCTRALRIGVDISQAGTTERGYRAEIDRRFRALFMEIAETFLGERRGYTRTLAWYRKARRVGGEHPDLFLRQIELVATYQRDHWQVVALCDRLLEMVPEHPQACRFKEQARKAMPGG